MPDLDNRGKVEGAGELGGDAQHVGRWRWTVVPDGNVQRIGGHILLGKIGVVARDAGGQGGGYGGRRQGRGEAPLDPPHKLSPPPPRPPSPPPLHPAPPIRPPP